MVEGAELFEFFDIFERCFAEGAEIVQTLFRKAVDTDVAEIVGFPTAVEGDWAAGKIDRVMIHVGDDFYQIRILCRFGVDRVVTASHDKRCVPSFKGIEAFDQEFKHFGFDERLIGLDVDDEFIIGYIDDLGALVDPVSAAFVRRGGEARFDAVRRADVEDFLVIAGDDDAVDRRHSLGGADHHRQAADVGEHFFGKTGGSETGRDDNHS